MPGWGQGFGRFKLDGNWTIRLNRDVERLMRKAAEEWLRAVILHVPVWSGMARGSLKFAQGHGGFLAQYLRVAIDVTPVKETKSKNQFSGHGEYSFSTNGHIYSFNFNSDVAHYHWNEFYARTDPGAAKQQIEAPWTSFQYGQNAWRRYIRHEVKSKRFFKIKNFMIWGNFSDAAKNRNLSAGTETVGA